MTVSIPSRANVCRSGISFMYNNNTYIVSTGYTINYQNTIRNDIYNLNNVYPIQTPPECNWYTVKR
jgi:hypothetical protein